jgi:hypothetical protein
MASNQVSLTSPTRLVIPALEAMAKRGFDVPCLVFMQQEAMRGAAQQRQKRDFHGIHTSPSDVKLMVDTHLLGSEPAAIGVSDEPTPAHVAAYMRAKQSLEQKVPNQLVREAEVLAGMKLPAEVYGDAPQQMTTRWLAQHLTALRQYADRAENATPLFARTLRTRADSLQNGYVDPASLKVALDVIQESAKDAQAPHAERADEAASDSDKPAA